MGCEAVLLTVSLYGVCVGRSDEMPTSEQDVDC